VGLAQRFAVKVQGRIATNDYCAGGIGVIQNCLSLSFGQDVHHVGGGFNQTLLAGSCINRILINTRSDGRRFNSTRAK
jgi:hypothetical protein